MDEAKPRILLVTSNGAGMGHLSRQLAVGLGLGEQAEYSIFSLSVGAPVVADHGIPIEYCPSYEREWMPRRSWNNYLSDRLVAISKELDIDVLLFDGVAPYPGIAFARALLPEVAFVWSRRGMWRPDTNPSQLRRASIFDLIIEPGDLASNADRGPTATRDDAVKVPPVSMLEVIERMERRAAAEALGLDPDRQTVLLTLGSGRLGDVRGPGAVVLESLLEDPEWQIGITKAAIALAGVDTGTSKRVVEIRGVYPLVRYLAAFDAVVSAAGYNAVHEFLSAGLPTLLVPNASTRTDDQVARAEEVAERGLALMAEETDVGGLADQVRLLSDPGLRARLSSACLALPPAERSGGAIATGHQLLRLVGEFSPSWRLRLGRSWRIFDERWRRKAKDVLGPGLTDSVRRALGRPSYDGPARQLSVRVVDRPAEFMRLAGTSVLPLLVTDRLDRNTVGAGPPVEHLIHPAGDDYRVSRRAIIERYYEVESAGG